jgi:hypothetical protein
MCGCKVSVLISDILECASGRIDDLNIAGDILLTPHFAEIGKLL